MLVAPYLRKFGAYTVPHFLSARYDGNAARLMGIIVLFSGSFTYVVVQIFATAIIASPFLGISFEIAVFVCLLGILLCSMFGGMRAVTWTQVAQYIVLIIAYLIFVIWLSTKDFGVPLPQFIYGGALQEIASLEQGVIAAGLAPETMRTHPDPFTSYNPLNYFALILCLMVGTASLPHILMRYLTTPSVRDARMSVGWSLFFIFLLYFTVPAYAAFAKLEVYQNVIGAGLDALPAWIYTYGNLNLVSVCGAAATEVAAVMAACGAIDGHEGLLRWQDLTINTDVIVISTPEIAGLPYVIAGLVAAGGLAAALSTADGLLLAIANALSHDIYYKMIDPNAPAYRRLVIARTLLVLVAIAAADTASARPADILSMVAWAFSLAGAGLLPALVMGVWSKKTTTVAAIAGMFVGFSITLFYLVVTRYFPVEGVTWFGTWADTNAVTGLPVVDVQAALQLPYEEAAATIHSKVGWFGLNNISVAIFGLPAGFLTMYLVSKITPEPSQELQDFIDEVRRPRGEIIMQDKAG